MKKLFAVLVALALCLPLSCLAEVDLSQMTFDELVALKDQINLAIWSSEEWQEVEVPAGIYEIGIDIPAGKWTIRAADGMSTTVKWGTDLEKSGVDIIDFTYNNNSIYEYELLQSPTYKYYDKGDKTEVTWDLKDGQYFIVDDGVAVFTPYAGKPSLGFK